MKKLKTTFKRANDGVGWVEVPNTDPQGHFMQCDECGDKIDLRQLDQVSFHETHEHRPDIHYSGSAKIEQGFPVRMCVHCAKSVDDCECRGGNDLSPD